MKRLKVTVNGRELVAPAEGLTDFVATLEGLDMVRFRVLLAVARAPGCTASDLARELGVDESTMCHLVRSMSEEGYYGREHLAHGVIRRDESIEDRRCRLLYLTERGTELLSWFRAELMNLNLRRD